METRRLPDHLIVRRLEGGKVNLRGLSIPGISNKKPQQGTVIVGGSGKPGVDGGRVPQAGDRIVFGQYSGQEIVLMGEKYVVMPEDEVLAVIDPPPRTGQRQRVKRHLLGQGASPAMEALATLKQSRPLPRSVGGRTARSRPDVSRAPGSAGLVKTGANEYQLAGVSLITVKKIMAILKESTPSPYGRQRSIVTGRPGAGKVLSTQDPREKYVPSMELVSLLKQCSLALSREESATLRAQARGTAGSLAQDRELASLVGGRIEGLLSNLARRAAASGRDVVLLADSERFPPDISAELIDRLDIDPDRAQEFLGELHRDLSAFAAVPRARSWGHIATDRGNLVLPVAVDKAKRPDFSALFERPWVVTK